MAIDAENTPAVIYLNRLSDLLFALARLANQHARVPDVPWKSGRESNPD
jgi:cob(I)alamin adenosyltransferase